MRNILIALLVSGFCLTSLAGPRENTLDKWADNHPEAAKALGEWVKANPKVAAKIFDWDGRHPEKSKEFVGWTLDHPAEHIDVYVHAHPHEPVLDEMMKNHREGTEAFMVWSRNHAEAARALMEHPKALEWAGHHLYKDYWAMDK